MRLLPGVVEKGKGQSKWQMADHWSRGNGHCARRQVYETSHADVSIIRNSVIFWQSEFVKYNQQTTFFNSNFFLLQNLFNFVSFLSSVYQSTIQARISLTHSMFTQMHV